MTTPSPMLESGSPTSFTVTSDGAPISSTFQIISIDTWSAVNQVPKARLVLFDGSAAARDFPISNLDVFIPGKKIEITAGYDGRNETIFHGIVVKQGIEINDNDGARLVVDITDPAIRMTLARSSAIFSDTTDSDLIGKLIGNAGLSKDVAATSLSYESIVQYYASDWDLMIARAEVNGLVVMVENGKVTVKAPDTSQPPVLAIEFGSSILDLQVEMNAATQYAASAITSLSWDPATQKISQSSAPSLSMTQQGNISSAALAKVFGVTSFPQQTGAPIAAGALEAWSAAEMMKSMLSKIRGHVRFQGSALAKLGKTIELSGVGERFGGPAFISGLHHSISDGRWLTTTHFGLSAEWFAAAAPDIAGPGAAGQLPPIKGLQTGIVQKISNDPAGAFRVFVSLPLLQADGEGVWARLGSFYASSGFGAAFYPEVNDEVVVGFMNEDPRYPVILGSLYSQSRAPVPAPDEANNRKAVTTRSKLEVAFDEEKKIIAITTPGGHSVKLDDDGRSISITDSNSNSVVLSSSGIKIDSAGDIDLSAKGNITVSAGGNLSLSAVANATMSGLQVIHSAEAKFSASGNADAELTAAGQVTVKGALVMIN
ncbi:MAG TPA: type VI secretion system tip protein VgrG [Aliidongia sp.]|nr:type VI secretion system tip protein VgrG [Aliidongia sp.]